MAASELTVRKRVTEILNACAPGTYSEAVDVNYLDRNSLAIRQAVKEAALMVARAIVINPNHVHRSTFLVPSTVLTSGDSLPDMSGEPEIVEIQLYNNGPWVVGVPRDVQQVQAYINDDQSFYSPIAHNNQNSPLSGYYALTNSKIFYTGNSARITYPKITSADVLTQIPDEYEPTWVCLAVGLTVKEGDNLYPIAQHYYQIGMSDLGMVTSMGTIQPVPDAELARQARGDN